MSEEVRVGLHCHSSLSDGSLAPAELAELVAAQGARYAALTDHDTVAGSRPFRQALSRLGVGCVDGVEITTASPWGEIHLLAYGVRLDNEELLALLDAGRRRADPGVQGLVDSLRRFGSRADAPRPAAAGPAEVIATIHSAGGAAFLAHPLSYGFGAGALETIVAELAAVGLDGLEAIYPGYSPEDTQRLLDLGRNRPRDARSGFGLREHGKTAVGGVPRSSAARGSSSQSGRRRRSAGLTAGRQASAPGRICRPSHLSRGPRDRSLSGDDLCRAHPEL
jgi:predicted metal-dependent phosphoesterase TrpH